MAPITQHIAASAGLALAYYLTNGRASVVLLLGFGYFYYVKEFSKPDAPSPSTEKDAQAQEPQRKHKHKDGKGGCGKLCTCKNKKDAPKKTLSALKAKKGFGQRAAAEEEEEDKSVAVDFTTTFAKAS